MSTFCVNCGFPQSAASAFCPQCGVRQPAGPAPTAARPPMAPAAAKSGSGMKIVAIALGCILVAGAAGIAGLYYAAHKLKQEVIRKAAEHGVDIASITGAASTHTGAATRKFHGPCDLLSKEDVARLIGEPIDHTEVQEEACLYMGPKGLYTKLATEQAQGAFKQAEAPGANVNPAQVTTAVDHVMTGIAAEAGKMGSDGDAPMLLLAVASDGKPQMAAMHASNALFSGIFKASGAQSQGFGVTIPGLGDDAIRLPKLGLHVLKGDTIMGIIIGPVPDANTRDVEVARAVLSKL